MIGQVSQIPIEQAITGQAGAISPYFRRRWEEVIDWSTVWVGEQANVRSFGAKGDGSTDDYAAFVAAQASLPSEGGIVFVPPGRYEISQSITPHSQVKWVGCGYTSVVSIPGMVPQSIIEAMGNFSVFETASDIYAPAWEGLTFYGTSASGSRGIKLANAYDLTIRDCLFNGFGDEAIVTTGGASGLIAHTFVQNALMVRSGRASYIGCIDIGTTDFRMVGVDSTASVPQGLGAIGSGFIAGIVCRGAVSMLTNCIGHLSQVGIVLLNDGVHAGFGTKLIGCRADLNQGAGFIIASDYNQVVGCHSYRNSQTANNAFPGISVTTGGNTFIGNLINGLIVDGVSMTVGIKDTSGALANPNFYYGNRTLDAVVSGLYDFSGCGNASGGFDYSPGGRVHIARLSSIPVFANNAAAIVGGLSAGDLYRTGADPDPVCVVH